MAELTFRHFVEVRSLSKYDSLLIPLTLKEDSNKIWAIAIRHRTACLVFRLKRSTHMKLRELWSLKEFKYRTAVSARLNDTIAVAIEKLVEHDRGSLAICNDKGELAGIITERDIVRKFLVGKDVSVHKTKIKDIMSTQVIIGKPDDDVSYAISVMKEKRIRHLPIMEGRDFMGMVSMRDLLGVQLEECRTEVKFLGDYISGGYQ